MSNIEIRIDNRKAALQEIDLALLAAMEVCGMIGEGYAKTNLTEKKHVDTGNLRNSVTYKIDTSEPAVYIGTDVEYGKYIETGTGIFAKKGGRQTAWSWKDEDGNWHRTRGMRPDPWLKPAVAEHLDTYKKIFEDALK